MSGYLPSIPETIEFEGDTVTYRASTLERDDFTRLAEHMRAGEDGKIQLSLQDSLQYNDMITALLPKYIEGFTGLRDGNGDAIPLEVVLKKVYFQALVQEIIIRLFRASRLDAEPRVEGEVSDEKK